MARGRELPTLERLAVIKEDGTRNHVHPADVRGRFSRMKPWVYAVLILVYASLPWIQVGGHPAVLIDIPMRHFYFFGANYNAQDFYLAFFLLTGIGFSLIVVSALWGRLWCGWACPQTVFLEGVYRRIERWIDGPRERRIALQNGPWTAEKVGKRVLKHGLFLAVSLVVAHVFVSYFVSMPRLLGMVRHNPVENWTVFLWMSAVTGVVFFNFFWFREQLCLVICPYGRLQSVLQDKDTLIIGYDRKRGEPRGKAKDPSAGACVDCGRCVAVCPTGIDIRNGLQMECIGCANCVDACDEVMTRLGRDPGLIRYDSRRGLDEGARRFWRPRVLLYTVAGAVGLSVAVFTFSRHQAFEANVVHTGSVPFAVVEGKVLNHRVVHLINKQSSEAEIVIRQRHGDVAHAIIPQPRHKLAPLASHEAPIVLEVDRHNFAPGMRVHLEVEDVASGNLRLVEVEVLGPKGAAP